MRPRRGTTLLSAQSEPLHAPETGAEEHVVSVREPAVAQLGVARGGASSVRSAKGRDDLLWRDTSVGMRDEGAPTHGLNRDMVCGGTYLDCGDEIGRHVGRLSSERERRERRV